MGRRRKASGLRKVIRSLYKILGAANTASYLVGGSPGKMVKHMARKRTSKWGSRAVK